MEAIKAQQEQEHVINSRLDRRFKNEKISRTLQKDREGDVS